MKALIGFLAVLALGYAALCTWFYVQQRALLYFPVPARGQLPTMPVPSADAEVRSSVAHPDAADALVYFGGNAEDVSLSAEELATSYPDHAIYALHYRGYGPSRGQPTETDLVADASALLTQVAERHATVHVIGRSLGSGVAVQAVAGRDVASLTLVTPFASIVGVGQSAYWFMPVSLLAKDRFESDRHVGQLRVPVRLLIAERDEVIPRWSSEALIAAFASEQAPEVFVIAGRGHNDVQRDAEYWSLLLPAEVQP